MPVRSCLWFRISTTKSTVSTKIYGKIHSGLVFYTGPGYDSDVMAPATKTTLPQPGLQRRWTAPPGDELSDGGDRYTSYDCPLPLVDDLRGGFAKLSAHAPWQCSRSQTRDDLRSGFARNEPLIAAKQCLGRTQRSLWLKDTGTELQPLVDIVWGYNALPRQRHRWVGLRRRRPHSAWPERSEGNQAGLRSWRRGRPAECRRSTDRRHG